jgi:uncharacterized membrane protein YdjX (TVP38/TMEM64 family)
MTTMIPVTAPVPAPLVPEPRSLVRRLAPAAVLVAGAVAFFALGLHRYISFETLREHRSELMAFVADHRALAPALFVAIYATATALSVPGGLVLSVTGGFLFGTFLGTAFAVMGATTGAVGVFLIARTALGAVLRRRLTGGALERMAEGFRENAFSYLLFLRLVPLFPFFVVNLAPAFLGVSLRTFVAATLLGIIPGAFVFASVGAGLGDAFEMGGSFSAAGLLTPKVITALVGLAALSLAPIAYKRLKAR